MVPFLSVLSLNLAIHAMATLLVPLTISRHVVRGYWPRHHVGLIQSYRCYTTPRDPLEAEKEAATVRGHRAARARLEKYQQEVEATSRDNNGKERPYAGSTLGGERQSFRFGRKMKQCRLYYLLCKCPPTLTMLARLADAWKTTPIKWYPIPVLLGAIVLVGVKARRDYNKDRNESRGKVVDENGKIVTMHGPWTVSGVFY